MKKYDIKSIPTSDVYYTAFKIFDFSHETLICLNIITWKQLNEIKLM